MRVIELPALTCAVRRRLDDCGGRVHVCVEARSAGTQRGQGVVWLQTGLCVVLTLSQWSGILSCILVVGDNVLTGSSTLHRSEMTSRKFVSAANLFSPCIYTFICALQAVPCCSVPICRGLCVERRRGLPSFRWRTLCIGCSVAHFGREKLQEGEVVDNID